jgi:hypothetical protein
LNNLNQTAIGFSNFNDCDINQKIKNRPTTNVSFINIYSDSNTPAVTTAAATATGYIGGYTTATTSIN